MVSLLLCITHLLLEKGELLARNQSQNEWEGQARDGSWSCKALLKQPGQQEVLSRGEAGSTVSLPFKTRKDHLGRTEAQRRTDLTITGLQVLVGKTLCLPHPTYTARALLTNRI